MNLSIRNADIHDAASIAELSGQLGYVSDKNHIQHRLDEILQHEEHGAYVAVDNSKVIGWIHGFCALRIESDAFVEIGGLVVHENYRNRGVGKALVESIYDWADSKACKNIRARCNEIRNESHAFYQSMGFILNKVQKVYRMQIQ